MCVAAPAQGRSEAARGRQFEETFDAVAGPTLEAEQDGRAGRCELGEHVEQQEVGVEEVWCVA